jgi:hypothetical protein
MFDTNRPLYSADGLSRVMAGLAPGGVLALWAADPSPGFERAAAGLRLERAEVDVAGIAHTIYLATR